MEQSKSEVAQNNLLAIAAAQTKFNEDFSTTCANASPNINPCYCVSAYSTGANPTGLQRNNAATAIADLNINLHLGISDQFTYSCTAALGNTVPLTCAAKDDKKQLPY